MRLLVVFVIGCGRLGFDQLAPADTLDAASMPQPLVWLDMNDASGQLTDRSGNGHHASCVAPACPIFGVDGAAQFDGIDDVARIPYAPQLDTASTAITISLWTRKLTSSGGHQMLVHRQLGDAKEDSFHLSYADGSDQYRFLLHTIAGETSVFGPDSQADLGRWVHMLGSYDGSDIRLFLDGTEVAAEPLTGAILYEPDKDLMIAAGQNEAVEEFTNTVLDDIRIYPFALDDEQRAQVASERL